MPIKPFNQSEETSFETGSPVRKVVKQAAKVTTDQAKITKNAMLDMLYGKSKPDPSPDGTTPAQQSLSPQHSSPASTAGETSIANQSDQEKLDQARLNLKIHMQQYFNPNLGEEADRKLKQEEEQKKRAKEQEEEEEKQFEMQKKQEQNSEIFRPMVAGRSRMGMGGKKAKTTLAVDMGKNKAEMFRGASG